MRRLHPKIIAFFLLLLFSQKLGLRLWVHHWLHEPKIAQSSHLPSSEKIQAGCDCIEDALMPLTGSSLIVLSVPISTGTLLMAGYRPPFSAVEEIFYSLKGPPARSI